MTYFSHLRTFVTVYRCGSHNKASEVMGLTQPAISKQIAALEQQLGKPLFHRNGPKRHEPTEVAHALANELTPHVDKIEEIFNASRMSTSDVSGIIYIGGLAEFIELHLTHTIAALIPHNIQFVLQVEKGGDWLRLLDNHTLDMAIVPMPIQSEVIGYRELMSDELVITVSAESDATDIASIIHLPFVAHNEDLPCIERYLASLPLDRELIRCSVSVGNFRMIKELVMSGAGFSIIPRQFIQKELAQGDLKEIGKSENLPRIRLYLTWNKFSLRKPRNAFVRDAILESISAYSVASGNQPRVYNPTL